MASSAAPTLLHVPGFGAKHAFTTRHGGVSQKPFDTANLGASVGDDPVAVLDNRTRVLAAFGATLDRTAFVYQVHGAEVVRGEDAFGPHAGELQADALICDDPTVTLAVSMADCLPLLMWDERNGAVAAVHAGWRGVVAGVVQATLQAMSHAFGSTPESLQVAIGPHIRQSAYQVGEDVRSAFFDAGFPAGVLADDSEDASRYRLSVEDAVRLVLEQSGVQASSIFSGGWCTASDAHLFFSHRRDRGATGRHWALLRAEKVS